MFLSHIKTESSVFWLLLSGVFIFGEHPPIINKIITSKIFNSSNMIDDTITYTLGEKVKHAIYGIGVIVGIDDKILTIAFPYPHEIKKIMKGHKSITKLN